jgi:hypothetical protein
MTFAKAKQAQNQQRQQQGIAAQQASIAGKVDPFAGRQDFFNGPAPNQASPFMVNTVAQPQAPQSENPLASVGMGLLGSALSQGTNYLTKGGMGQNPYETPMPYGQQPYGNMMNTGTNWLNR